MTETTILPRSKNIILIQKPDLFELLCVLPKVAMGWHVLYRYAGSERGAGLKDWLTARGHLDVVRSRHLRAGYDYFGHYNPLAEATDELLTSQHVVSMIQAAAGLIGDKESDAKKLSICLFGLLRSELGFLVELDWIASNIKDARTVRILPTPTLGMAAAILARSSAVKRLIAPRLLAVMPLAVLAVRGLGALARSATKRIARPRPRAVKPVSDAEPNEDISDSRIVFFPHDGVAYGNLFDKDYFFRNEPGHPLNRDRIPTYEYTPPRNTEKRRRYLTDSPDMRAAIKFTIRGFSSIGYAWRQGILAILLLRVLRQITRYRAFFLTRRTSLAFIGYEILCPPELIVAAQSAGVRCIAIQERLALSLAKIYSFILDDYFILGESSLDALALNHNVLIERCEIVGPIRASWLLNRMPRTIRSPAGSSDGSSAQKMVLVLDCISNPLDHDADIVLEVSWTNNRLFLEDILRIAEEFPQTRFVIRGKDAEWMRIPFFSDLVEQIEASSNVSVNADYDRLQVSYDLVVQSSLLICRYTSLGDEALAVGIPTIFYERTVTGDVFLRSVIDYAGYPVFATDFDQLLARSRDILNDSDQEHAPALAEMRRTFYAADELGTPLQALHGHLDRILVECGISVPSYQQ